MKTIRYAPIGDRRFAGSARHSRRTVLAEEEPKSFSGQKPARRPGAQLNPGGFTRRRGEALEKTTHAKPIARNVDLSYLMYPVSCNFARAANNYGEVMSSHAAVLLRHETSRKYRGDRPRPDARYEVPTTGRVRGRRYANVFFGNGQPASYVPATHHFALHRRRQRCGPEASRPGRRAEPGNGTAVVVELNHQCKR